MLLNMLHLKEDTMARTGGHGRNRKLDKKPLNKDEVRDLK